jgi:hypothetical protein
MNKKPFKHNYILCPGKLETNARIHKAESKCPTRTQSNSQRRNFNSFEPACEPLSPFIFGLSNQNTALLSL